MSTQEYQFDDEDEVERFVDELLKIPVQKNIDTVLNSARTMKFSSPHLRDYFLQYGKNKLSEDSN